jgi:hypothetical protein
MWQAPRDAYFRDFMANFLKLLVGNYPNLKLVYVCSSVLSPF